MTQPPLMTGIVHPTVQVGRNDCISLAGQFYGQAQTNSGGYECVATSQLGILAIILFADDDGVMR